MVDICETCDDRVECLQNRSFRALKMALELNDDEALIFPARCEKEVYQLLRSIGVRYSHGMTEYDIEQFGTLTKIHNCPICKEETWGDSRYCHDCDDKEEYDDG